ncbi:hypothetical protein GCM10010371_09900 [Streptomyces subrutilus]|uniref:Serine/arginine repetitive matrix protein 2 n=1 Tax=Streptomyces subrutilus TaxID=36818 RepID=A0A5P2UJD3_9ACTN|nr:hypothetical protein [Streptomyces subrutilus]QEU79178.1 hypothetical protein CP968_13420 [Streptomyces subrutilus]GGZ52469.1 hypothetical protein GCM10010371_09900 [Streptomyces subrutilus]
MAPAGGARWDPRTQRWVEDEAPPADPAWYPPGDGDGRGAAARWRPLLLVAVAAAVVGGAAVAGWAALGPDDPKAPAAPPAAGTPGPSGPAADDPRQDATAGADPAPDTGGATPTGPAQSPSAPDGHTVVLDEDGFSVAVPTGWERSAQETGSGAFYRAPGDRSALLQVFRVTEPATVGACDLLRVSSQALDDATPAYREVGVERLSDTSCELVYEYDSAEANGRRHGIERIVVAPGGGRWALLAAGPATDTATVRARLTAAVDSFRPR